MDKNARVEIFGGEEAGQASMQEAKVVVVPLPLECTVSYGKGTGAGPQAILDASENMELFDEITWGPYWDFGRDLHTLAPAQLGNDPKDAVERIAQLVRPLVAAGKVVIGLGGEHTVTVGMVDAVRTAYPGVGVLHIDAHADLRDSYDGSPYSHACVIRRIVDDFGLPVVSCGIRSLSQEEADFIDVRSGDSLRVGLAHKRDRDGEWIQKVVDWLPKEVYITLDMDGLDPSLIPGTGTPEPGGLAYGEVVDLIRRVGEAHQIVGADVTEVAPIEGHRVSEFVAARLVARLIRSALQ